MKTNKLHVHIVQMNSADKIESNLDFALKIIRQVPDYKPAPDEAAYQLICFPENSLFMRIKEGSAVESFDLTESFWPDFVKLAKQKNLVIHLGSIAVKTADGHKTNSSVIVHPKEGVTAGYAKIHLFDIELEGQKPIRESDAFKHGEKEQFLHIGDWVLGQSICYDIRFSELYQKYAKAQVDAILVPAAFLVPTGKAHWEILLRARAIESQAYVVASSQAGTHKGAAGGERMTFGHSLVIGPWGEILHDAGPTELGVFSVVLERSQIDKVRRQIPMRSHRRL